jgi:hypothetical protein
MATDAKRLKVPHVEPIAALFDRHNVIDNRRSR